MHCLWKVWLLLPINFILNDCKLHFASGSEPNCGQGTHICIFMQRSMPCWINWFIFSKMSQYWDGLYVCMAERWLQYCISIKSVSFWPKINLVYGWRRQRLCKACKLPRSMEKDLETPPPVSYLKIASSSWNFAMMNWVVICCPLPRSTCRLPIALPLFVLSPYTACLIYFDCFSSC